MQYLTQELSKQLDLKLFKIGFSIEQLMELAGLSVASAIFRHFKTKNSPKKVLFVCGPGNNGGDGLVASRHLSNFKTFRPSIYYPKPNLERKDFAVY
ncbi:hypothetical protein MHBO_001282 [Bonamia ostreae]|uniref:NAD(P)H-hydrate epimerase n=1 Tax=Bonamia ostreae TaxID=126728 RepID=A0ABV2AIK1_9EUKA